MSLTHRVGGLFETQAFSGEPESISLDIEKESATGPDESLSNVVAPTPTIGAAPQIPALANLTPKAAAVSAKAQRIGGLTAEDLRGLNPNEVDQVVRRQIAIDEQSRQMEELLGTTSGRIETSRLKQAELGAQRANAIHKAKESAAKAIAESDLPPEEQAKRLEVLSKASDLQSVYDLSVSAYGLPKRENVGTDREAVASELFGKRYGQLDQEQKGRVNSELLARTQPATEVVTNEEGVWVVDKRSGTARLVTVGPSTKGSTSPGTVYRQVSPVTSNVEQRQQGATVLENVSEAGIARLAEDIKNVSKEQAVELYSNVILSNSTPLAQRTFRAALVRAYPDLAESLPQPSQQFMSDTEATTPEARVGTGPTTQLKVGDPLSGKEKRQPTSEQAKAYGFGTQLLAANGILNRLEAKGETGTNVLLATLDSLANTSVAGGAAAGAAVGGTAGAAVGAIALPFIVGMVLRNPALGPMTRTLGGGVGAGVGGTLGAGVGALTVLMAEPLASIARRAYGADSQSYLQAKNDFIAAILRKTSGAAINRDEYVREEKRFFPSPLDTPQVIKQKAQARARAIRGIEQESGRKLIPE